MILLAIAKFERTCDHSSINTQRTTIMFVRLISSTTLLPRGETLLPTAFTWLFRKYLHFSSTSKPANHQHPKIFKYIFACGIVLAANHQYPGNIQRLAEQQQSTAATSYHPASSIPAATSNHPARCSSNQQQQSTAAINSSNQQQQRAAATSSRNQQQQPPTATSSSGQQQRTAATTGIHPTSST